MDSLFYGARHLHLLIRQHGVVVIKQRLLDGQGDSQGEKCLEVELITPVALEKGLRFAIREGGRTVGAGTVSEIVK